MMIEPALGGVLVTPYGLEWSYTSINKVYIGAGSREHHQMLEFYKTNNHVNVVSASSAGSGWYCHFLHPPCRSGGAPGDCWALTVSWRPFQIECRARQYRPLSQKLSYWDNSSSLGRLSSWFDVRNVDNTRSPADHHTQMVTFKRSGWFNLKQSRINSNLLAAHQAWRGLDLAVYCVQMLLLFLRPSSLSPPLLATAGGHEELSHTVTMADTALIQINLTTSFTLYIERQKCWGGKQESCISCPNVTIVPTSIQCQQWLADC